MKTIKISVVTFMKKITLFLFILIKIAYNVS